MSHRAPWLLLSLACRSHMLIYIYVCVWYRVYIYNYLVHFNTILYRIRVYIYVFSMFISNNNDDLNQLLSSMNRCSIRHVDPSSFIVSCPRPAGLVAERGYSFRARRWRTLRWWRYTGAKGGCWMPFCGVRRFQDDLQFKNMFVWNQPLKMSIDSIDVNEDIWYLMLLY